MSYTITPSSKSGSGFARTFVSNTAIISDSGVSGLSTCADASSPYTITSSSAAFGVLQAGDAIRIGGPVYLVSSVESTSSLTATILTGTHTQPWTDTTFYKAGTQFRNVAVGGSITLSTGTYVVDTKPTDGVVTTSSTAPSASSSYTWTYLNPALAITTVQSIQRKKNSTPMKINFPILDSDTAMVFDTDGVEGSITVSVEFVGTNLDTQIIPVLESLCDGQQFTTGTITTFSTDMPARTYKVFFQSINWEYSYEYTNKITANLEMLERGV